MFDGVFNQRLQQKRRQARQRSLRVQVPADLQPLSKANLLNRQVALRQRDFLAQRDGLGWVSQRAAKQLTQVFQHCLSL